MIVLGLLLLKVCMTHLPYKDQLTADTYWSLQTYLVIPSCRYDVKNYNICILETSFLHRHFFGGIRQQLCGSHGSKIRGRDALWDLIPDPIPPGCRRSTDESRQSANQARCTKVRECDRVCVMGQLLCSVQKYRSDLGPALVRTNAHKCSSSNINCSIATRKLLMPQCTLGFK